MRTARIFLGFSVFMLVTTGLVVLASAGGRNGGALLAAQSVNVLVAAGAGVAVAWFNYRWWARIPWLTVAAWLVTVALLAAVLWTEGKKGSKRWLDIPHVASIQPGEFAKLMAVIVTAWWATTKREGWMARLAKSKAARKHKKPGFKARCVRGWWLGMRFFTWLTDGYFPGLVMVGVMVGLLILEPDIGTTLLACGFMGLVLLLAGLSWPRIIIGGVLVVALVLAIMWSIPNRRARMQGYLHSMGFAVGEAASVEAALAADPDDPVAKAKAKAAEEKIKAKNYQTDQSLVAFGNALRDNSLTPFWDRAHRHPWWDACTGVGYMRGMQKLSYLPEHDTDFIFAVGAEEMGFFYSLWMVTLFTMLFGCSLAIGLKSEDKLGMLLAIGMGVLIYSQALYNIGVVTGRFPAKGLALPFTSHGGSHLLAEAVAVGTLFSVSLRNGLPKRKNKSTISVIA